MFFYVPLKIISPALQKTLLCRKLYGEFKKTLRLSLDPSMRIEFR